MGTLLGLTEFHATPGGKCNHWTDAEVGILPRESSIADRRHAVAVVFCCGGLVRGEKE
jgi:hypothetical protein